jgi:hypothetical protein
LTLLLLLLRPHHSHHHHEDVLQEKWETSSRSTGRDIREEARLLRAAVVTGSSIRTRGTFRRAAEASPAAEVRTEPGEEEEEEGT